MRYFELLETPISSMEYDGPGGDFSAGSSFSTVDKALLQSEKGKAKMVKAFSKTPFDIEVFFTSNDIVDGDDRRDNRASGDAVSKFGGGVSTKYDYNKAQKKYDAEHKWKGIKPSVPPNNPVIAAKSGVIRVIVPTNLSNLNNKTPMTPWTLAHKIGHCFQDYFYTGEYDIISHRRWDTTKIGKIITDIGVTLEKISKIEKIDAQDERNFKQLSMVTTARQFNPSYQLKKIMTMKSARAANGKARGIALEDTYEFFPELIAQYLISGKITMDVKTKDGALLVDHLNQLVGSLLAQAVGKVLVTI